MFGIVLKFHSQTTSVEGVITIPVIILKQHAACCFIGLTMNNIIDSYCSVLVLWSMVGWFYCVLCAQVRNWLAVGFKPHPWS